MNQLFRTLQNDKKLLLLACIFSGLAVAKLFSLGVMYFTEKSPILDTKLEQRTISENYKLSVKFGLTNKISANATTQNWKLRAIFKYTAGSFIVFEDSSKTVFLNIGESYSGYKLEEISIDGAKLSNGGASFILKLDKKNGEQASVNQVEQKVQNTSVRREKYEKYAKDTSLLSDEIQFGRVAEGVVVNSIKNGTFLSEVGIQKGDILTEVNGEKVTGLTTLLNIFKEPEKTKTIKIILLRQNLKKELIYEIN